MRILHKFHKSVAVLYMYDKSRTLKKKMIDL